MSGTRGRAVPKKKEAVVRDPATVLISELSKQKAPDGMSVYDEAMLHRTEEIIAVVLKQNPPSAPDLPEGWVRLAVEECKRMQRERLPSQETREKFVVDTMNHLRVRHPGDLLKMSKEELENVIRTAERASLRTAGTIDAWGTSAKENTLRGVEEFLRVAKAVEPVYKAFVEAGRRLPQGSAELAALKESTLAGPALGEKERERLKVLLARPLPREEPRLTGQALQVLIKQQPNLAADLGVRINKAVKRKGGVMGGVWAISPSTRRENTFARETALADLFFPK